jgi:hypothetical protein
VRGRRGPNAARRGDVGCDDARPDPMLKKRDVSAERRFHNLIPWNETYRGEHSQVGNNPIFWLLNSPDAKGLIN